jgi:demethylmenaquinone methyltransferase/2-methoxy-6-polyprenyl-1,4-benzoquinol methylase
MDAEGLIDWAERVLRDSDAIDHWQKDRERIEAEELLAHILGHDFDLEDAITLKDQATFETFIERRATGEPTQLITGVAEFRGLTLIAKAGTFIPRDSSEFLAAEAIRRLKRKKHPVGIDMACGTGLNFPLLEKVVGPGGRIVGVDLTDAMLARAQDRIAKNGWSNISLVQADAAGFDFPAEVDAILSTYALTQVPECADVIAHGAKALSGGGRWAVLDLKVPGRTPPWLAQLGTATVRPFASIDEWMMRRPWEAIRVAMQEELADVSWTELFFGTAFLAAGSRGTV